MTSKQMKDLLKNMSKMSGINAQILQRNYLMERLLERISLSEYKNNFILKGGMLVAAMVGIDSRSTMDMDALKNAKTFVEGTIAVDFSEIQNKFLNKLAKDSEPVILDFGCGSGRDTKYFLKQGFHVEATDGSEELCKLASEYTGIKVRHLLFTELNEENKYDGIWACASILHLPKVELNYVLIKMKDALKANGIIYTSFKYGNFDGEKNGRYFTDMTEETFADFINNIAGLSTEEYWISSDVRPGRGEEKWLNLITPPCNEERICKEFTSKRSKCCIDFKGFRTC